MHLSPADYLVIGSFAIAFFGLLAWVIGYAVSTRGHWVRTREGRHLMMFRSSLVVFMGIGVINNIFGNYPGRDPIRVIVVSLFAFSVIDGLRTLIIAQREGRALRREQNLERLHSLAARHMGAHHRD